MDKETAKKQLYTFCLSQSLPGREEAAMALMDELIARQEAGRLNPVYLLGLMPRVKKCLRPESLDPVLARAKAYYKTYVKG